MGSRGSNSGKGKGEVASVNRTLDNARRMANQVLSDYGINRYTKIQEPNLKQNSQGYRLAQSLIENPARDGIEKKLTNPSRKTMDEARVWLNYEKKSRAKMLAGVDSVSETTSNYAHKVMSDMVSLRTSIHNIDAGLEYVGDRLARRK